MLLIPEPSLLGWYPLPPENDCNCGAYEGEHPMGVGDCNIEYLDEPACSCCHSNCEIGLMDVGVGLNEFWGSVSFHSEIVEVSDCCGAEIINQ